MEPSPRTFPPDHADRLGRARLSLEGLSVGDAFGEGFFGFRANIEFAIPQRWLAPAPWPYTDDTMMAVSIVEILAAAATIDQDDLAERFARRFVEQPDRGYGMTATEILQRIALRTPWRVASKKAFAGQGSMGNGSAMRVAPLGAYFADDGDVLVAQATASAEVTHAHPEGVAGAIAVAAAAAGAWALRNDRTPGRPRRLFEQVISRTPPGSVRDGLCRAANVPFESPATQAAGLLGNGSKVTCPDTVPFCVWCAAGHLDSFEEALWATVSALGDADTNCAIVGGIVALSTGLADIPKAWLTAREPLPAPLAS